MTRQWFFARRRRESERNALTQPYEIQLLNESGQAVEVAHFGPDATEVCLGGYVAPPSVVAKTKTLVCGHGEYLNEAGEVIHLF